MDGVLNIDKPAGMTSHDVVAAVRKALKDRTEPRAFPQPTDRARRKVGHAGTLDPIATGVLLVLIGKATRVADLLMEGEKEYQATCTFGKATTTHDATGEAVSEADASSLTREQVASVLQRFRGRILQTPPMVSAVHHQGRRLYELAREGQEVKRAAREVTIHELELLDFRPGQLAEADLRVVCSRGTYVRVLCADLGGALGLPAHMSRLRRTRVGRFTIDNASTLDEALAGKARITPIDEALADLPALTLDEAAVRAVRHGNPIPAPEPPPGRVVKLRDRSGQLLALAQVIRKDHVNSLQPYKVFADP